MASRFQMRTRMRVLARLSLGVVLCGYIGGSSFADDKPSVTATNVKLSEKPATEPRTVDDRRIQQLIEQLGSDDYVARRHAQEELVKIAPEAFDALTVAESAVDPEIASRATYLTRLVRFEIERDSDSTEVRKILADYESQSLDQRLAKIDQLLKLSHDDGLDAACRLVRFDHSLIFSKRAAIKIATQPLGDQQRAPARAKILLGSLGNSNRTAAGWLQTLASEIDRPAESLLQWQKILDQELALVDKASPDAEAGIVSLILRHQIELLQKLGRPEDALAAMRKLPELESSEEPALIDLIDWLVQHRGWDAIKVLATRHAAATENNPMLKYVLAEAWVASGDKTQGRQLADQAFAISPENYFAHVNMAKNLQLRGQFQWSEREYRHAIKNCPTDPGAQMQDIQGVAYGIKGRTYLAEMLHDLEQETSAAEVLKELVTLIDTNRGFADVFTRLNDDGESTPAAIHSRYHYFLACSLPAAVRKQRKSQLDAAIQFDETDADVLIALYRLPDQTRDEQKQTKTRIERAMAKFYEQIDRNSTDTATAMNYNQLAWLEGNTIGDGHGDYSESIALSKKSLEIHVEAPGYLDTLAHCYFKAGDLENAVRYQSRAAELDKHSLQITKALGEFQAALAKQKADAGQ